MVNVIVTGPSSIVGLLIRDSYPRRSYRNRVKQQSKPYNRDRDHRRCYSNMVRLHNTCRYFNKGQGPWQILS